MIAVALGVVLSLAGPASAQQRTVHDRRGDAPASADMTRVLVRNGQHAVSLELKVRDLRRLSDVTIYVNHAGPGRYAFRTGGTRRGMLTFETAARHRRVACADRNVARHLGPASTMTVRIPQHCFGQRSGRAAFSVIMFEAGGQGSDRVGAMPITLRRG